MASYFESIPILFINPDGSTTNSYLKAHDEAEIFWDFGTYLLPWEWN